MKTPPKRLCIYSKDVQKITGKRDRYSRRLIQRIRHDLQKKEEQFLTIEEFCHFTGLNFQKVLELICD